MTSLETNHPADALARVREQIKELQRQEEELKAAVLAMPEEDRVGRWYEAKVRTDASERLDTKRVREELGHRLAGYMIRSERTVVSVAALE